MLMFDRIIQIDQSNGDFNKGLIKAELDIKDDLWFFDAIRLPGWNISYGDLVEGYIAFFTN